MNIGAAEVHKLDESALRDYSMPGLLLMENAGRSVSEAVSRDYPPCKVLVFAGKGNNGGDGLVAARHLANHGYAVRVAFLGDPAELRGDPLLNFSILNRMKLPQLRADILSEEEILASCREAALVVDAILGVGIRRAVSGAFENAIRAINRSGRPVVSIDIPSGLDADSGQVHGTSVVATKTVTLALPKRGLYEGEGPRYAGKIEVADIGMPRALMLPFLDA